MFEAHAHPDQPSVFLRYLPRLYEESEFVGRFLRIFEEILAPVHQTIGSVSELFDPSLTPPPLLKGLAAWVGSDQPAGLPESRWRELIKRSVWLHRWRGTKRGLGLALELATGKRPLITEQGTGIAISSDASLGLNTLLNENATIHIDILFECSPESIDKRLADGIIRHYKPGHVSHSLTFRS